MKETEFQRSYRGPLRAVIFDWAGTTIDFGSCGPVNAFLAAFAYFEVPITPAQARGPMGMAKRDHVREVLREPEIASRWYATHGQAVNDQDVERIYQRFLVQQKELLADHAGLISGLLETLEVCRRMGLKIGSSTGYTRELMQVIVPLAAQQGYEPAAIVCADDVSPGRPAPWMCFENARQLGVFPTEAIVKVDDTTVGIQAGLNAGMWTVGVVRSGNLVGMSELEFAQLGTSAQNQKLRLAETALCEQGAHYLVDTVAELPLVLEAISARLREGVRP